MTRKNIYILSFEDCAGALARVGSKNANLCKLMGFGVRVPPGFAVTTDAYIKFFTMGDFKEKIQQALSGIDPNNPSAINKASKIIRQEIEKTTIPKEISEAIMVAYEKLSKECGVIDVSVSARSSGTSEDLPGASFAGQYETYLWIRGFDKLLEKILKCWSSLFTPRAIAYRIKMGIEHEKALMSVGVQKMVNSKVAGVMFTLNPLNGDTSKISIEGSWGLGETIVSGTVTPDRWVVDKGTLKILERNISPRKEVECTIDPKTDTCVQVKVKGKRRNISCLCDEEIIEFARQGRDIEQHFRRAQDIEWAIDKDGSFPDNVYIMQTRPETVWSSRKEKPKAEVERPKLDLKKDTYEYMLHVITGKK